MSVAVEDEIVGRKFKFVEGINDDDEVEIKIEYNESTETDPLCENYQDINCDKTVDFKPETCSIEPTKNNTSEVTWHKSIDDSERFICKFCELKYSSTQTLRYHVKTKHPEEAKTLMKEFVKSKRKKRIKCYICNKSFKEISILKDHVQSHHNLEENFRTWNNKDITESLYIKPKKGHKTAYICYICGYHTISKSHYNQHINTHISEKSMKCQYCDYATNHVHNFKVHERKHTKCKPYVCNVSNCGYRCSSKSALKSHQCKHNPQENMLYCDKCGYSTIYKQCLKRHIDSHKRNSIRLKLL